MVEFKVSGDTDENFQDAQDAPTQNIMAFISGPDSDEASLRQAEMVMEAVGTNNEFNMRTDSQAVQTVENAPLPVDVDEHPEDEHPEHVGTPHEVGGDRIEVPTKEVSPAWNNLVQRIRHAAGLRSRALDAMLAVDRVDFVPGATGAYEDHPIRIGHSATISAPHMHAFALGLLEDFLQPGSAALDVGCGSGFLSAVMAHMVGPKGSVIGMDYLEPLVELSRANIAKEHSLLLDSGQLVLEVGDGWKGRPAQAPFDAIHVGAAAATMPDALIEQLKPGGRMVIPVGREEQVFLQVDKDHEGRIQQKTVLNVRYVPLVKVH